jgi:hypothetical protein
VAAKKPTTDRKKPINFTILQNGVANKKQAEAINSAFLQSGFYFENLEDPYIDEHLSMIKKDTVKVKKFKEMVDFYTQNK